MKLANQLLQTINDADVMSCVSQCNQNSDCMSFNHYNDSGVSVCELNSIGAGTVTLSEASDDCFHYTPYQCSNILRSLS